MCTKYNPASLIGLWKLSVVGVDDHMT